MHRSGERFAAPTPAPVSQTLTGTWFRRTQHHDADAERHVGDGHAVAVTFEAGNGVTVAESGIISGTIAGEDVALTVTDRLTINGTGLRLICTAGRTFTGVLSGNTLSGTMLASNASPVVRQRRRRARARRPTLTDQRLHSSVGGSLHIPEAASFFCYAAVRWTAITAGS
jgi:hypothetical protein